LVLQNGVYQQLFSEAGHSCQCAWFCRTECTSSCSVRLVTAVGVLGSAERSVPAAVQCGWSQLSVCLVLQNGVYQQLFSAAGHSCQCAWFCRTECTSSCSVRLVTAVSVLGSAERSAPAAVQCGWSQLSVCLVLQNAVHQQLFSVACHSCQCAWFCRTQCTSSCSVQLVTAVKSRRTAALLCFV